MHRNLAVRTVSPTEPEHQDLVGHRGIEECAMDSSNVLCMFQPQGRRRKDKTHRRQSRYVVS